MSGDSCFYCRFGKHAYGEWYRCPYRRHKLVKWDTALKCKRFKTAEDSMETKIRKTEKHPDSHLFLYAKHWYKRTDEAEDLKKIYGRRNGIEPEHISDEDIFSWVLRVTFPYIRDGHHLNEILKRAFILHEESHRIIFYPKIDDKISFRSILKRLLANLGDVKIKEIVDREKGIEIPIINLEEPDYSILPRRKDG